MIENCEHNKALFVDMNTAALIKQVLNQHAMEKKTNPLNYSQKYIHSQLFNDLQIAHHLSTISDESFQPIVQSLANMLPVLKLRPIVVLNIGSGEGVLTKILKATFSFLHIIDLDLSPEMLEQSQADECVLANALEMPLPDGHVDVALSHCTLRYISTDKSTVNLFSDELKRILKPSGIAFISETNMDVIANFQDILHSASHEVVLYDNIRMFRCSSFYSLYESYHSNDSFRKAIDKTVQLNNITLLNVLELAAGFKNDQVKVLRVVKQEI
jgi:ubiquinone/menaquinone biosynthesis C-methylase UbiE